MHSWVGLQNRRPESSCLACIYLGKDANSEFSNQSAVNASQSKSNVCIEFSVGGKCKMSLRVLSFSLSLFLVFNLTVGRLFM